MKQMKPPICENCKNKMSPTGGVIGDNTRTTLWKCWDCGTEVEDLDDA